MRDENGQSEYAFTVGAEDAGRRIDVFCSAMLGKTRSSLSGLFENGFIRLNGSAVSKSGTKLAHGDEVLVSVPAPRVVGLIAQAIPLDVIYEDSDLIVVNKPRGMVVHPAAGHSDGTLVNALMYRVSDLSGIGGELRPGIVHRIDKLTSGLIVVAKNDAAHQSLAAQIKEHSARRTYIAIVEGNIKDDCGVISAPIGRHPTERKRMAVVPDGRSALTRYRVLDRYGDYTLVCAMLETGRTHQIRVHMAYINHPIAGDNVYGKPRPKLGLDGQALHALRLELTLPSSGERMVFTCGVPDYFRAALVRLGCELSDEGILALVESAVKDGRE